MINLNVKDGSTQLVRQVVLSIIDHASPLSKQMLADAIISNILSDDEMIKSAARDAASDAHQWMSASAKEAVRKSRKKIESIGKTEALKSMVDENLKELAAKAAKKEVDRIFSLCGQSRAEELGGKIRFHLVSYDHLIVEAANSVREKMVSQLIDIGLKFFEGRRELMERELTRNLQEFSEEAVDAVTSELSKPSEGSV